MSGRGRGPEPRGKKKPTWDQRASPSKQKRPETSHQSEDTVTRKASDGNPQHLKSDMSTTYHQSLFKNIPITPTGSTKNDRKGSATSQRLKVTEATQNPKESNDSQEVHESINSPIKKKNRRKKKRKERLKRYVLAKDEEGNYVFPVKLPVNQYPKASGFNFMFDLPNMFGGNAENEKGTNTLESPQETLSRETDEESHHRYKLQPGAERADLTPRADPLGNAYDFYLGNVTLRTIEQASEARGGKELVPETYENLHTFGIDDIEIDDVIEGGGSEEEKRQAVIGRFYSHFMGKYEGGKEPQGYNKKDRQIKDEDREKAKEEWEKSVTMNFLADMLIAEATRNKSAK